MQVIPNGIPDKARSDPAVRQVQGTHHAENVPAKRVCLDDVLDHDGGSHFESLEVPSGPGKNRFGPQAEIQVRTPPPPCAQARAVVRKRRSNPDPLP